MSFSLSPTNLLRTLLGFLPMLLVAQSAAALDLRVTVTNLAPLDGVAITPLWVGFHDGSFDSYNNGLSSQPGLESLAEDGNTANLSADFLNGLTYVSGGASTTTSSSQAGSERVDGTLASASGPPPILPGGSASQVFTVAANATNQYFSYAAMVIPSNDFFVANGNPLAHDLMSLFNGAGPTSFLIGTPGTVNDAGTEAEDFAFTAGNPLFPAANLPAGQSMANEGPADALAAVSNVTGNPFADFLNQGGTNLGPLNFNDSVQYAGGAIARVTIEVVPEPSALLLLGLGLLTAVGGRRR